MKRKIVGVILIGIPIYFILSILAKTEGWGEVLSALLVMVIMLALVAMFIFGFILIFGGEDD